LNYSNNNSYHSHNQTFNISQYNRFSVLNTSDNSEDMPESSFAFNPSFNGSYRNNKSLFLQTASRSRDKTTSRSQKSFQKNDNNFNFYKNLLYSPNGRSPNTSNNGVGCSNYLLIEPCNEITNSPSTNFHNHKSYGNTISDNSVSNNGNSNIDIASLNSAILSLSKNIEFIYNLARSAYLTPNVTSAARFTLSNVNNK